MAELKIGKYLQVSIASLGLLYYLFKNPEAKHAEINVFQKAKEKIDNIHNEIKLTAKLGDIDAETKLKILSSDIRGLRQGLDNQDFTSVEILLVYLERLRNQGISHNCINGILLSEALNQAEILDKELKQGFIRGVLHGIPISVKDVGLSVKGFANSFGLANLVNNIQTSDSLMISHLKDQGAIIYLQGSVPQSLSSFENFNNITGCALNPHDFERTPGGSSGGDAILVALNCASLAIGGDLIGSIRVPASFCGISGLKPTYGRLINPPAYQFPVLNPCTGPMAKSVDDLAVFMSSVCDEKLYKKFPLIPNIK